MNITQIEARLGDIKVELKALSEINKEEGLNEDQLEVAEALNAEVEQLSGKLESLKAVQAKVDSLIDDLVSRESEGESLIVEPSALEIQETPEVSLIPAVAKGQRTKHFASSEDAYLSGMYLASLQGDRKAAEFMAAQDETNAGKGIETVPTPLSNALINLLEEYGVARRACRRIAMSSLTWTVPKVTDHATVSYPDEAAQISESDVTFGQVQLVAKKIAALVKMSTEVTEDSIISMMDTVIDSIAYSVAIAEDNNLFNGVAGGINTTGIKGDANVADVNVASVAALALTDLTSAQVAIGNPVVGARNEWYINSTLYHGPIRDLVNAAGGNTIRDFEGGQRPLLLGAPVNFVNVLPGSSASASGDLLAVYGDFNLGCYFGDRRALNFRVLNELYAETDQVGVQATERIDIKVANPEVLSKVTLT